MSVASPVCSGLSAEYLYNGWRAAAGSPIHSRNASALAAALNWSTAGQDEPQYAVVPYDIWAPQLYFGALDSSDPPCFLASRDTPVEGGDPDHRVQIGLDPECYSSPQRPQTHIDFPQGMQAVWVEVNEAPATSSGCGILFQQKDWNPGTSQYDYTTLASLRGDAFYGGVTIDFASNTSNPGQYHIDRVVFDPAEATGDVRLTRLVRIAYRSMAVARAQQYFQLPYKLVALGSLAPDADPQVQNPEFGDTALDSMWPHNECRYRMNTQRMVAGTYYEGDPSGTDVGNRPGVWYRNSGGAWTLLRLVATGADAGNDQVSFVACAITDAFEDANGDIVVVVGGSRTEKCPGTDPPVNCGKPHAYAWRILLDPQDFASGIITPTGVAAINMGGQYQNSCNGSVVDQSIVLDLKTVGIGDGQSRAIGCGMLGMWCGRPNGLAGSRTLAAAFAVNVDGGGAYSGYTQVMDAREPYVCMPTEAAGPSGSASWQTSTAFSFVRGAPGSWAHSAVGILDPAGTCTTSTLDTWCDVPHSAIEWGWNSLDWLSIDLNPTAEPDLGHFPAHRMAPTAAGSGSLVQAFGALSAVRTNVPLADESVLPLVSSAGWLLNGNQSHGSQIGCPYQASVVVYRDEIGGGGCWAGAEPASEDCLRILNLHEAMWSPGGSESAWNAPLSKASSIAASDDPTWAAVHTRWVLGARYDTVLGQFPHYKERAIIWMGQSPCLDSRTGCSEPSVPESEWCGLPLQMMVDYVVLLGGSKVRWNAITGEGAFIASGQDVTDKGRAVGVFRRSLVGQPYQLCMLQSRVDLTGDDFVDGADLGVLLGDWGTYSDPEHITEADLHPADLNNDGKVDGADLGILLGGWGHRPVVFGCGDTAMQSNEIEVVSIAAGLIGQGNLDELMLTMSLMASGQAEFLAEYLRIVADQVRAQQKEEE